MKYSKSLPKERRSSRVLSSTSKQLTSCAKIKDYNGPKSFQKVIDRIHEDSHKSISREFIVRVITLFFNANQGVLSFMTKGVEKYKVKNFGTLEITKQGKKEKDKLEEKIKYKKKYLMRIYRRRWFKKKRMEKRLNKINENRSKIDLKPLTMEEYMIISKRKLEPLPSKKFIKEISKFDQELLDKTNRLKDLNETDRLRNWKK